MIKHLARIRRLVVSAFFAACVLLHPVMVMAQEAEEDGSDEKGYGLAYLLVILVIALGLAAVLRPTGRSTEIKPKSEV